jgi:hypothetical protein
LSLAASQLAEPLNIGFGLFARVVRLLTNLGDVLVLARWLYVDNETLFIGGANDPPIGESRTGQGEQESAEQDKTIYMKGPVQLPTRRSLPRIDRGLSSEPIVSVVSKIADVNLGHVGSLLLSANNRVFCLRVIVLPGRRLIASSYAARATR